MHGELRFCQTEICHTEYGTATDAWLYEFARSVPWEPPLKLQSEMRLMRESASQHIAKILYDASVQGHLQTVMASSI